MKPLIEELPGRIAKLEQEFGSENPFVRSLREQLRAMQENVSKPTQDVYMVQTMPLKAERSHKKAWQRAETPGGALTRD